jgi:3-methyladenine DNA glycosylase AlkD
MDNIIESIRKELNSSGDEKVRIQQEHFFKEEVKFYGLNATGIRAISNSIYRRLTDQSKQLVFRYCEDLFKPNIFEESAIACEWSYKVHKQYVPGDFATFDKWINKYVTNWAICDSLCNHSVGTLVAMYPELISGLKKWAGSENRWVRRASAVSLIIPARQGLFVNDIFEIADILHFSKDDMVQKGYGWMLKAASEADCNKVFEYVMSRKATMPRTSLRYAIEKMPAELKSLAMAK